VYACFHDLRDTWASWHRRVGTSVYKLKDLGGRKACSLVDRYAKFATDNLAAAAARIERKWQGDDNDRNVVSLAPRCPNEEGLAQC